MEAERSLMTSRHGSPTASDSKARSSAASGLNDSTAYPDNVYAQPSQTVRGGKATEADRAKIQWAWMADTKGDTKTKVIKNIDRSAIRADLLDVVRLLSSRSMETQTTEPSFVMKMNNVRMETDHHRSIAIQIGAPKEYANKAMQVLEADIVRTRRNGGVNIYTDMDGGEGTKSGTGLLQAATATTATGGGSDGLDDDEMVPSHYNPTCDITTSNYPIFMSDARAMGVSNKYGFVSLPQHVVQLPPRRRKKFVAPVDVPFLYGTHELSLDDNTTSHLGRAHALWSQCTGFVPKY